MKLGRSCKSLIRGSGLRGTKYIVIIVDKKLGGSKDIYALIHELITRITILSKRLAFVVR